MKSKTLKIVIVLLLLVVFSIIVFTIITYNKEEEIKRENIEKTGLKITVEKKEYVVKLANNDTVLGLQKLMPIEKYFTKYEDKLYYAKVGSELDIDGEIVSTVKEKGVYYHTGWKSVIIAYKNYTFKKQKLVYLGSIKKNIPNKHSIQMIGLDTNRKD